MEFERDQKEMAIPQCWIETRSAPRMPNCCTVGNLDFLGNYGGAFRRGFRHCRRKSSAFWGHIILYVLVQDPVVGTDLFVEMWRTPAQAAPPSAGENGAPPLTTTILTESVQINASRLIRPISARSYGGPSLRSSAAILVSRFANRSRTGKESLVSGSVRRNISRTC